MRSPWLSRGGMEMAPFVIEMNMTLRVRVSASMILESGPVLETPDAT